MPMPRESPPPASQRSCRRALWHKRPTCLCGSVTLRPVDWRPCHVVLGPRPRVRLQLLQGQRSSVSWLRLCWSSSCTHAGCKLYGGTTWRRWRRNGARKAHLQASDGRCLRCPLHRCTDDLPPRRSAWWLEMALPLHHHHRLVPSQPPRPWQPRSAHRAAVVSCSCCGTTEAATTMEGGQVWVLAGPQVRLTSPLPTPLLMISSPRAWTMARLATAVLCSARCLALTTTLQQRLNLRTMWVHSRNSRKATAVMMISSAS